jgi:microcystin-dependent protein
MTGRTSVPTGWLLCNGQAVSRTTFADLFAAIDTTYGIGDGSTTFNVPDMRQRFPLGKAASGTGSGLGDTGGAIDHVHDLDSASSGARISFSTAPEGLMLRKALTARTANFQIGGVTVAGSSASTTNGIELEGDSDTENPPFQTVNYKIKT